MGARSPSYSLAGHSRSGYDGSFGHLRLDRLKRGNSKRQEPSLLLKYLGPDRFWIKPLGASQLAATGVTACGTQTVHFSAQINVRDRVEELLMLGEYRPYQIPVLVELHVLADV